MQSRRIYTVIGIVVLAILVIGGGISYYYQQKTPHESGPTGKRNNREREEGINMLVDALYDYSLENGEWPGSVDLRDNIGTWYAIAWDEDTCDPDAGADAYEGKARGTTNVVEMSKALIPSYLAELPHDPQTAETIHTSGCTGYEVKLDNRSITIEAPRTETDNLSRDKHIRITRPRQTRSIWQN